MHSDFESIKRISLTAPPFDQVYRTVASRLETVHGASAGAFSVLKDEQTFWCPPTISPQWTPRWDVAEADQITFFKRHQFSTDGLMRFRESMPDYLPQHITVSWQDPRVRIQELRGEGISIRFMPTRRASNLRGPKSRKYAEITQQVAAAWGLTATLSDSGGTHVSSNAENISVEAKLSLGSSRFDAPLFVELTGLNDRYEYFDLLSNAIQVISSTHGEPNWIEHGLQSVPSHAEHLKTICESIGGNWASRFSGAYSPQLDLTDLEGETLADYLPLLQVTVDFYQGMIFQLGLRKTTGGLVIEAYSSQSEADDRRIFDGFEYELESLAH